MSQQREYGKNEIMGDAPQSIERRLTLPTLDNMSFGDLRYIADSIDEYGREVQAMLEQKREERITELRARMEADKAALAELCPPQASPTKMANPSTPKYRDPEKPENTWAGRGKMPGWLKKKQDEGASLDDFLVDKPAALSSTDDPGF